MSESVIPLTSASTKDEQLPIENSSSSWQNTWKRNKGLFLILLAELFGALMVTSARLLQNGTAERPGNMLTLQIIFVRFLITCIMSTFYMWYTNVPDFPWGKPEDRWLLFIRGLAGFFGVYGFYYSVKYLPIAEAIVLGFFTPLLSAYTGYFVLGTPFTRRQVLGGIICLLGVIIIARPASLFHLAKSSSSTTPENQEEVPTTKRLLAITLGIATCFCNACIVTIIRLLGERAHALISVNYYAITSCISSFLLIIFLPGISFQLPDSVREWLLLFSLGIFGFLLQFLMTKGLQLEKGPRGTNMMYCQIVFALLLDWGIWGVWPTIWSWVGGSVVVGSSVWIALQKDEGDGEGRGKGGDEEEGFIGASGNDGDEEGEAGEEEVKGEQLK